MLDLSRRTSIKPSSKSCNQVSHVGYQLVDETIGPSSIVIYNPIDETTSILSEVLHLSGMTSINPSGKTYDQVSQDGYWLRLLGMIYEYDLA